MPYEYTPPKYAQVIDELRRRIESGEYPPGSLLRGRQAAPPWMRAELVRLQAAFPEFSFGICPGWRGPVFEAWRETGTGDLYAVITADAQELWHELELSKARQREAADAAGQEPR